MTRKNKMQKTIAVSKTDFNQLKMAKKQFTFVVAAEISLHLDVEAASLEEAVEAARHASVISLCHQCASGSAGEWSTSGELDTCPAEADLVEVYCNDQVITREVQEIWTNG